MDTPVPALDKKKRLKELDVLRAVAVLMVLGRHVLVIPDNLPAGTQIFFRMWREMGWIGVDLFFVISGFLVSGLLFREFQENQRVSLFRFLIRRGFKIYPSFYLMIGATFVMADFLPLANEWQGYVGEAIFLQNYFRSIWNHTWSLGVEEHFYILLSIIVYVVIRANRGELRPFSFLPTLIVVVAASIFILRCMTGLQHPVGNWQTTFSYTHFRIDSLFFGVLLAYLFHFNAGMLESATQRLHFPLLVGGVGSLFIPLLFPLSESRFTYTVGFSILYLGSGALLMLTLFSRSRVREWMLNGTAPLLVPIGKASYSIYLWHMFVYYLSGHLFLGAGSPTQLFFYQTFAYLLGSVLVGLFIFRLVEAPFLTVRERLCP